MKTLNKIIEIIFDLIKLVSKAYLYFFLRLINTYREKMTDKSANIVLRFLSLMICVVIGIAFLTSSILILIGLSSIFGVNIIDFFHNLLDAIILPYLFLAFLIISNTLFFIWFNGKIKREFETGKMMSLFVQALPFPIYILMITYFEIYGILILLFSFAISTAFRD